MTLLGPKARQTCLAGHTTCSDNTTQSTRHLAPVLPATSSCHCLFGFQFLSMLIRLVFLSRHQATPNGRPNQKREETGSHKEARETDKKRRSGHVCSVPIEVLWGRLNGVRARLSLKKRKHQQATKTAGYLLLLLLPLLAHAAVETDAQLHRVSSSLAREEHATARVLSEVYVLSHLQYPYTHPHAGAALDKQSKRERDRMR